jgi:DNA-binding NarL/FixJ family response regulator
MKRFLIVDDHTIIREGVGRILQGLLGQTITLDEASCGQQALDMAASRKYDLVLLDISLPDQNGLNVLKTLRQNCPAQPVIVFSTHPDEHYAVRSLRAGAAGYVNKGSDASVLKEAIEKVLIGKRYVSSNQSELLADALTETAENQPVHQKLSDREYQMVCMMTAGKTLSEIAKELTISVKTVSTYRARVLEKLHLRTTADIINYGIQQKFTL